MEQRGQWRKIAEKSREKAAARPARWDKTAAARIVSGSGGGDTPLSGFARAGDKDRGGWNVKNSGQKVGGGCTKKDNNTGRKTAGKKEIEQDGRRRGEKARDRAE